MPTAKDFETILSKAARLRQLEREREEIWLPLLEAAGRVNDSRLFEPVRKAREALNDIP